MAIAAEAEQPGRDERILSLQIEREVSRVDGAVAQHDVRVAASVRVDVENRADDVVVREHSPGVMPGRALVETVAAHEVVSRRGRPRPRVAVGIERAAHLRDRLREQAQRLGAGGRRHRRQRGCGYGEYGKGLLHGYLLRAGE